MYPAPLKKVRLNFNNGNDFKPCKIIDAISGLNNLFIMYSNDPDMNIKYNVPIRF